MCSILKEHLGDDFRRLDTIKLGEREVNSRAYVARFNFSGTDQQKKVGLLSGGERNRVHLARMLKSGANVLLLDEPTNDLDVNTMRALEEALESFGGCALVISHDRWFLDRICTHILALKEKAGRSGSTGITRSTKRTRGRAWARLQHSRIALSIGNSQERSRLLKNAHLRRCPARGWQASSLVATRK